MKGKRTSRDKEHEEKGERTSFSHGRDEANKGLAQSGSSGIADDSAGVVPETEAKGEVQLGPTEIHMIDRLTMGMRSVEGPVPSPEMLEMYEKIVPGAGEKLIKLAETQIAHRRKLELHASRRQDRAARRMDRGQWMGYSIALLVVIVAAIMGFYGNTIVPIVLVIGALGVLIYPFITGTRKEEKKK